MALSPDQSRIRAAAASRGASAGASRRQISAALPKPTMPGTLSVPDRYPRSCPPPSRSGSSCDGRAALRHIERPDALGTVHLVGAQRQRDRCRAGARRAARCLPPAPHRNGSMAPCDFAIREIASSGCSTPISLLRGHHADERVSSVTAADSSSRSTSPSGLTPSTRDTEPVALERQARIQHRAMLGGQRDHGRASVAARGRRRL